MKKKPAPRPPILSQRKSVFAKISANSKRAGDVRRRIEALQEAKMIVSEVWE